MLATRVVQKEGTFYFIAYKAADLLDRVSFTSRYYFEGEQIEADEPGEDEVARFIAGIEKSEKSIRRYDAISAAKETMLLGRYVISQIVRDPLLPSEMIEDSKRHLLVDRMRAYQANSKIIWARVLGLTDS